MKFFNINDPEKRKTEHIVYNGNIIAVFKNGELETDDKAQIEALKGMGYPFEEEPKKKKNA